MCLGCLWSQGHGVSLNSRKLPRRKSSIRMVPGQKETILTDLRYKISSPVTNLLKSTTGFLGSRKFNALELFCSVTFRFKTQRS